MLSNWRLRRRDYVISPFHVFKFFEISSMPSRPKTINNENVVFFRKVQQTFFLSGENCFFGASEILGGLSFWFFQMGAKKFFVWKIVLRNSKKLFLWVEKFFEWVFVLLHAKGRVYFRLLKSAHVLVLIH